MVFWDNTNYQSYELAAKGEDGLAVVAVLYEVSQGYLWCLSAIWQIRTNVSPFDHFTDCGTLKTDFSHPVNTLILLLRHLI